MPEFESHLKKLNERIDAANGGKPASRTWTLEEQKTLFDEVNRGMKEFIREKRIRDAFAAQELRKVIL